MESVGVMTEFKEVYDDNSEPYISKYEMKKPRRITKQLGRPRKHTEEEVIQIRNEVSLNCYYKNKDERLRKAKEYYEKNKEEILKRRAERKESKTK